MSSRPRSRGPRPYIDRSRLPSPNDSVRTIGPPLQVETSTVQSLIVLLAAVRCHAVGLRACAGRVLLYPRRVEVGVVLVGRLETADDHVQPVGVAEGTDRGRSVPVEVAGQVGVVERPGLAARILNQGQAPNGRRQLPQEARVDLQPVLAYRSARPNGGPDRHGRVRRCRGCGRTHTASGDGEEGGGEQERGGQMEVAPAARRGAIAGPEVDVAVAGGGRGHGRGRGSAARPPNQSSRRRTGNRSSSTARRKPALIQNSGRAAGVAFSLARTSGYDSTAAKPRRARSPQTSSTSRRA